MNLTESEWKKLAEDARDEMMQSGVGFSAYKVWAGMPPKEQDKYVRFAKAIARRLEKNKDMA